MEAPIWPGRDTKIPQMSPPRLGAELIRRVPAMFQNLLQDVRINVTATYGLTLGEIQFQVSSARIGPSSWGAFRSPSSRSSAYARLRQKWWE
eukprot:5607327-Pyramimonas_sp.AAC.1